MRLVINRTISRWFARFAQP